MEPTAQKMDVSRSTVDKFDRVLFEKMSAAIKETPNNDDDIHFGTSIDYDGCPMIQGVQSEVYICDKDRAPYLINTNTPKIAVKEVKNLAFAMRELSVLVMTCRSANEDAKYIVRMTSTSYDRAVIRLPIQFGLDYLAASLRSIDMLSVKQISAIAYQMLCGLAFLHSLGVIHCDLHPGNVGLSAATGVVQLFDFGYASYGAEVSVPRTTAWPYVAPEALTTNILTPKTDVWSVGVTLFVTYNKRNFIDLPEYSEQEKIIKQWYETDNIVWKKKLLLTAMYRHVLKSVHLSTSDQALIAERYESAYTPSLHHQIDRPCADTSVESKECQPDVLFNDLLSQVLEERPSLRLLACDALQSTLFKQLASHILSGPVLDE